jgi:hypothetical protein
MQVDPTEIGIVRKVLWPTETVEGTVKQRRIGPGGSLMTPSTVVVTDKRLILVNRASLGMRQDYEVIPYNAIVSVRLEHGIISSSVFIRVEGYSRDEGLLKNGDQEGEIDGLRNKDAIELADYINKKLENRYDGQAVMDQEATAKGEQIDSGVGAYVYCNNCGTKNLASAKFCSKCGKPLTEATA